MNRYAGLFGKIAGGRVSGVQAEGDVTGSYEGSGSDVGVGGFAGFVASSARIATSWCSGQAPQSTPSIPSPASASPTSTPFRRRCSSAGD